MMARAAPLLAVAAEAAPSEPEIAAAYQAGREATRDSQRRFWVAAASDGLLPPGADLDWLADTTALLVAAETYLLGSRILHWSPGQHEQWLAATMRRLAVAAPPPGG
jgi:hypothetical protein